MDPMRKSPQCPAPWRKSGRHEAAIDKLTTYCRACGAILAEGEWLAPPERDPKSATLAQLGYAIRSELRSIDGLIASAAAIAGNEWPDGLVIKVEGVIMAARTQRIMLRGLLASNPAIRGDAPLHDTNGTTSSNATNDTSSSEGRPS